MTVRASVDPMLLVARELFAEQRSSYSWDDVENLVRWDPELFDRALRRASTHKYVQMSGSYGDVSLWIACNLTETMRKAPWCYFCSRPITRDDFFNADAQVEHFEPRCGSGTHEPANVTIACASCNALKSDLTADDFRAIINDSDAFFATHGQEKKRRRQLEEFAEIYFPRVASHADYMDRHGIESRDVRQHRETLMEQYRRKWQTSH